MRWYLGYGAWKRRRSPSLGRKLNATKFNGTPYVWVDMEESIISWTLGISRPPSYSMHHLMVSRFCWCRSGGVLLLEGSSTPRTSMKGIYSLWELRDNILDMFAPNIIFLPNLLIITRHMMAFRFFMQRKSPSANETLLIPCHDPLIFMQKMNWCV